MSIKRLHIGNGGPNMRLNIFTDTSEEAMCMVVYLQEDLAFELSYVIRKYRVAPIRHKTISKLALQAAVDRIRRQILIDHDVKIANVYH